MRVTRRTKKQKQHQMGQSLSQPEKLVDTGAFPRTVRRTIDRGEVLEGALRVRLHRRAALGPVRGAHLAVLVDELERLHEAQRLVDGAAHGEVVHGDLAAGRG